MYKNKPLIFALFFFEVLLKRIAKQKIITVFMSLLFLSLLAIPVQAQEFTKDSIETKFDFYRQRYLQEKIFVHTDKNNYVTGEICWFKIYNVDAYFHKPLNFGKVAYVEILDKNNQPVLQAKVSLDKGTGNGSFYLPASIASGNYKFRAYTNWMKNTGAEYLYEKNLSIINVQKNLQENISTKKMGYEIAFFPEGGNLVNGIESKVGFKVTNQFGKGIYFDGWLLNEKGDTIVAFHPLKFGMGHFSFTPSEGSNYKAFIKLPGGAQQQKELPSAHHSGYSMYLENTYEGQIKITVSTPEKSNSAAVFLFVHTRNVVKAAVINSFQNGKVIFSINDTIPGDGISHFTIFNERGLPVCERLYFKKPLQTLNIIAATDQSSYASRKKITIGVTSATGGKGIPANMSMAVYRVDSLNTVDGQTINHYLLLSSDLEGAVESPEYYFATNSDTVNAALDNLMLTQGWRRFKWQDIQSDQPPTFSFLPEINGHIITGKLIPLHPGLPVEYTRTYLSAPGTRTQFQTSTADKDGGVKFEMKNFYTSGELIVQTNYKTDSLYRFNIDPPFFSKYSSKAIQPFYLTAQQDALLKMYISTQVQQSFLYDKLNISAMPLTDTNTFYGKPDKVYLLDNYVRFTTLEEVLREYVPDVIVRWRGGKFSLPVLDHGTFKILEEDPLVLLDAVPVFDFNKLMLFDALKIRKLEVVARKYILGVHSFSGVVNFTTYKGDMGGFEIDPRATVIDYEGLQLKREFYSPVYDTQEQLLSRLPDFRNLLYWCPELVSSSNGKAQTKFYSSDLPGRYAVVIQGLSDDGKAGATVVYFDVNRP